MSASGVGLLPVLCTAGAVLAGWPSRTTQAALSRRLLAAAPDHPARGRFRSWWPVALVGVGVLLAFLLGARTAALLLPVGGAAVGKRAADARRRRRAARRRAQTADLCSALVTELRTGVSTTQAFLRAAEGIDDLCPTAVASAVHGGDVAASLRSAARAPGAEGLRWLAACWETTAVLGAALGPPVTRLAASLVQAEHHRREVAAALAGPRATARLLAGLPVVGVLLGIAVGADPLAVLFGTSLGLACLIGGGGLTLVGLAWVDRLAARAEEPP